MTKENPCSSVCRLDGRTGWCLGCGRTIASAPMSPGV
ncbi:DUF1289 domain-containing protein [Microvirga sp. TS319]